VAAQFLQVRTKTGRDAILKIHGMKAVDAQEQHMFDFTPGRCGHRVQKETRETCSKRWSRRISRQFFHALPPKPIDQLFVQLGQRSYRLA
jgi:hypothetical protein